MNTTHTSKAAFSLFLIQIFATLGFAVLYSTLVLFMTSKLQLSDQIATNIMGTFVAFNYALHLLGGYAGGRLTSYRNLFCIGLLLQVLSCLSLAQTSTAGLYWGLAIFLAGAGVNVTCINCMLTQLFEPTDKRREAAFLWNYSGMNLGFLIGFSLAGYFQFQHNYRNLFLITSGASLITLVIAFTNWNKLRDRHTTIVNWTRKQKIQGFSLSILIMLGLILGLKWLLQNATLSNEIVAAAGCFMAIMLVFLARRQKDVGAAKKIYAYLFLGFSALIFWTLYQLAPMGLTLFAERNVDRHLLGFIISPQWILNINTLVIIIGGPTLAWLFKRLRARGIHFSIPSQFSAALILIGIAFVILPLGIHFANNEGYSNINWIITSYVLQSIGELLLSPIGYAMVGELAPVRLQGIMMGTWLMISGVGATMSNYFSTLAIKNMSSTLPTITNTGYSHIFNMLGWSAILCGILLFIAIPFLRKLINN